MTRRLRHSPADCYIGDFFPCPVDAGDNLRWYCTAPPIFDDPDIIYPPHWIFHRAAWRSDSGPFVLDVFIRKA